MMNEGLIYLKGYNKQGDNYLKLFECGIFTFHMISSKEEVESLNLKLLGRIEGLIDAEQKIETGVKFNEAVKLIEEYIYT